MANKQKLDLITKVNLIKRYLFCELGLSEATRESGVAWKTTRRWLTKYEEEVSESFGPCLTQAVFTIIESFLIPV